VARHNRKGIHMSELARRHRSSRGFSLIELLIVMVIIGLLAALVGPMLFSKVSSSKLKAAKAQIVNFGTALDSYRLDVGTYPTTQQGLAALRAKPEGADNWDGPYLKMDVPPDPWNRPYNYKAPGDHGDYDILSYGLDGQAGGEGENADVTSWTR